MASNGKVLNAKVDCSSLSATELVSLKDHCPAPGQPVLVECS